MAPHPAGPSGASRRNPPSWSDCPDRGTGGFAQPGDTLPGPLPLTAFPLHAMIPLAEKFHRKARNVSSALNWRGQRGVRMLRAELPFVSGQSFE